MVGGRRPFRAIAHLVAGIRSEASKCTTCAAACTPESVRPAANVWIGLVGSRAPMASSRTPCTLRPLRCRCQPQKEVPSYCRLSAILSRDAFSDSADEGWWINRQVGRRVPRRKASDQFDNGHLSVITTATHRAGDARVAATTVAIAIRCLIKQGVHQLFVVDVSQGPASG